MLIEKCVIFQPLEWFVKNAFKDIDDQYWETEKDRNNYNQEEEYELNFRINDNGSQSFNTIKCGNMVSLCYADNLLWAVNKFINSEDDAEYFV